MATLMAALASAAVTTPSCSAFAPRMRDFRHLMVVVGDTRLLADSTGHQPTGSARPTADFACLQHARDVCLWPKAEMVQGDEPRFLSRAPLTKTRCLGNCRCRLVRRLARGRRRAELPSPTAERQRLLFSWFVASDVDCGFGSALRLARHTGVLFQRDLWMSVLRPSADI